MIALRDEDEFWNELIYKVCDKDVARMREFKRADIFDFFDYIEQNARNRTTNNRAKQPRSKGN